MVIKREYVVLIVLIVALAGYLYVRNPNRTHYELADLPDVGAADVTRIEVAQKGKTITIEKRGDAWKLLPRGWPADREMIDRMVRALSDLSLTALVSESGNYDRYGLSEDLRVAVRAWSGEELVREVLIGRTAGGARQTFVKVAGDDNVYHARGSFRYHFDRTPEDLRDKSVLAFSPSEITEIEIFHEGESLVFEKLSPGKPSAEEGTAKDGSQHPGWQTVDGETLDAAKIQGLLSVLYRLRCDAYLPDTKKDDLKDPVFFIRLKGGDTHSLFLFPATDQSGKQQPATSSQNDYVFTLSENLVSKILIDPATLFDAE